MSALDVALDALEEMVFQYLHATPDDLYGPHFYHSFMSAGETATTVLARCRPDVWKDNGAGLTYLPWTTERGFTPPTRP